MKNRDFSNVVKIDKNCAQAVAKFEMPSSFAFGTVLAPLMIRCQYQNKVWGDIQLLPYGPISISPAAKVFHYSQEIFEGLKAYKPKETGHAQLFRPSENAKRFNISAKRMAMPEFDENLFVECCAQLTFYLEKFIPQGEGESLYLRPFMIATEEHVGLKPSSEYEFYIIATLAANYFQNQGVKAYIQREMVRAFPGGTGNVKTGGNYGASMMSTQRVVELGYHQTLWLDAKNRANIEEFSGMNIFWVQDGILYTPKLTSTILPGITRDAILKISQTMNIVAKEVTCTIDELLDAIKSGQCTEVFACGTAAVIAPLVAFYEKSGEEIPLPASSPLANKLKEEIINIQSGTTPDPCGFRFVVPRSYPSLKTTLKEVG